MIQKYGKKINEVWDFFSIYFKDGKQVAGRISYTLPNGINHAPTPAQLIVDGRRLVVPTEYDQTTHKLVAGRYSIIDAETMQQDAITLTPEELTEKYAEIRFTISTNIYQICESKTERLRSSYSVTEAVRWTEDREAINLNNWSHFDVRAGSTMTGQQYAESRVIPKMEAGNNYLDQNIGKRTDLLVALDSCPDEELSDFDYTSIWDEASDYVAPVIESDPALGSWGTLMSSIPWNIKLF